MKTNQQQHPVDLEAQAKAQLTEAEAGLANARTELQKFAEQNFRATPAGIVIVTDKPREWIDAELHKLSAQHDQALSVFHRALREYSQYNP